MFFWFWRGFSPNPRKVNYILGQTVSFWKVLSLANWLSFLTYEFCRNSHRSVRHGDVIMAKELGKEDPPYSQKSCFGKQQREESKTHAGSKAQWGMQHLKARQAWEHRPGEEQERGSRVEACETLSGTCTRSSSYKSLQIQQKRWNYSEVRF